VIWILSVQRKEPGKRFPDLHRQLAVHYLSILAGGEMMRQSFQLAELCPRIATSTKTVSLPGIFMLLFMLRCAHPDPFLSCSTIFSPTLRPYLFLKCIGRLSLELYLPRSLTSTTCTRLSVVLASESKAIVRNNVKYASRFPNGPLVH
jgi:hypothetical protein